MARHIKIVLLEIFLLQILLLEAAEWIRQDPSLPSDYLDLRLAPLRYQLARAKRWPFCWVLLKNGQPIAHASAGNDCEAIQILAKRC